MPQRIKGQETTVQVVTGGVLEDSLTDITSFNCEPLFENKTQGYLGQTTNLQDMIYNGVRFDMELHLFNQDWFKFERQLENLARRITPDLQINIMTTLLFPNGDQPTILIPDAQFGSTPMSIPSRGDYIKVKLQGMAAERVVQI